MLNGNLSDLLNDIKKALQDNSLDYHDKIYLKSLKAKILVRMGRHQDAVDTCKQLLEELSTSSHLSRDSDVQTSNECLESMVNVKIILSTALEGLGKWDEALELLTNASSSLNEVPKSKRPIVEAKINYMLGTILWRKGKVDDAFTQLEKALHLAESHSEAKELLADIYNRMGTCHRYKGNVDTALEFYMKSLNIRKEMNDTTSLAVVLSNIGNVHFLKGQLDTSLKYHHQSLELKKKIGNKQSIARSLNNLGVIYRDKGEHEKALECYQESLKIHEEIGNSMDIADVLNNIGGIYRDLGDLDLALKYYQQSSELVQKQGNDEDVALALNNIGTIYRDKGEFKKALDYYQKSLELRRKIGNPHHVSYTLNNIGSVYREQGEFEKALECYQESLELRRKIGNPIEIAETLLNLGITHYRMGNETRALESLQECLQLRRKLGNRVLISEVLFALIPIVVDAKENQMIEEYMNELEQCARDEPDNKLMQQRLRTCHALVLLGKDRESMTRHERLKIEIFLDEVVSEPIMDIQVTLTAALALCQHLLEELQLSLDPEILKRLNTVLNQIKEIATTQNSHWLLAETLWLEAKLAYMEGEFLKARMLMTRAQVISETKGFNRLAEIISKDHDHMLDSIEQLESKEPLKNISTIPRKMDILRMKNLLRKISRQNIVSEITDSKDTPVLLLIMAQSGILIHSREFTDEINVNHHLISALFIAIRSFSREVFNEGLDRMKLGAYTVVFTVHETLLLAYVCKGSSYSALFKLQQVRSELENHPEEIQELLQCIFSGHPPPQHVTQWLDSVITQLFQR